MAEMSFKGAWQATRPYGLGQVVSRAGNIYICTRPVRGSTAPGFDSRHWTVLSKLPLRGSWDADTAYEPGDVVSQGTGVYVCTALRVAGDDAPADDPDHWDVLVAPRPAFYAGHGEPESDLGTLGDHYLDVDSGTLYELGS